MLELIIVVLVIMWLLGFALHVGSLIHILLVLALVAIVLRLFRGSSRAL